MDNRLTVVVPVYNVENYLNKCLESIVSQTRHVDEIIIVDDGSTDGSGAIADAYAANYTNIKVIHQKNGGLSAARNTGIDRAQSDYITFVDSDDYIDRNMYEKLMENMLKEGADISIGGVWREDGGGLKNSVYPEGIFKVWGKTDALIQLNSYNYFNMSFCDKIFKRSLFEGGGRTSDKLRFPVGKICEDYYLMHQVIARAETIVYTSQPFYHYVQRNGSISRNKKVSMAQIGASMSQLDFYNKWFPDLSYIAETACCFSNISVYSTYVRQGIKCPSKTLNELRYAARRFLKSVLKNSYIPKIKKVQAVMFCYCTPLYKWVIARTKHR